MIYDVAVADQAAVAIDDYVGYLAVDQQAPQAAETMLGRISHAIDSLADYHNFHSNYTCIEAK